MHLSNSDSVLTQKHIFKTWWPLATSWLLMGFELPILSAFLARMPDPKIHLAAYGGVVFPLALLIESPIIMLLAASTALSKDWLSYKKIRHFMRVAGGALTLLHVLVAFTPLYDWLIVGLFSPPAEIVEPARVGLRIMTPWTFAIAYRRFNQGVLIRFGHPRVVTKGTLVRLLALVSVLSVGFAVGSVPGVVLATGAIAVAVTSEAFYIGFRVHPVLRDKVRLAPQVTPPLNTHDFFRFYVPLVMTSLLGLLVFPLGSAAISRMPRALDSLAVWPVISGFLFLVLSVGIAYNEVVVTLLEGPHAVAPLRRFAWTLGFISSGVLLLMTATPLATLWFAHLSGLSPALALLAQTSMWFALLRPALSVMQNWYQGAIIHHHNTRGITEAVLMFLFVSVLILAGGVWWKGAPGVYVGQLAFVVGALVQVLWLRWRSKAALCAVINRSTVEAESHVVSPGAVS